VDKVFSLFCFLEVITPFRPQAIAQAECFNKPLKLLRPLASTG